MSSKFKTVGFMLPLGRPYAKTDLMLAEFGLSIGYNAVWLQDWPVGVGDSDTIDHGTGHDPILYASHISRVLSTAPEQIGIAALRLDYRRPSVVARAIVSAQFFLTWAFSSALGQVHIALLPWKRLLKIGYL